MTVTNRYVDPIPAEETPGGFLKAARSLPAGADWTGGITFTPSCGTTDIWSCVYGQDKQNIDDKADPVRFDPFLIYAGTRCSGAPDVADLQQLTEIKLARGTSRSLARELHSSNALVGNPDLVTTATDLTPGSGPVALKNAIAGLLSASGDCGGGALTIHAPLVALPALMDLGLVSFDGDKYSVGGHLLIVDDYPNEPPTGGAAADADEAWLYVTGPVEFQLGERIDVAHFTGHTNESIVLAERLAIVRFDPCCVFAILADIC